MIDLVAYKSQVKCAEQTMKYVLKKYALLHIMCGYQCDKAMTKNGTREVI